jgi:type III pantothenate kinase
VINLLIDIGNTCTKASFAKGLELEETIIHNGADVFEFIIDLARQREVDVIAVSSVRSEGEKKFSGLKSVCNKLIVVGEDTLFPVKNCYKTPGTLGSDRILSAVAANALFPGRDIIVFDFGTALTVDFISKNGEFKGGNISPGLKSRFRALSDYTQRLPLIETPEKIIKTGGSTKEAIESGVVLGLIFEVEGYIRKYPHHNYIFTGGDAIYFAEKLKSSIFVVYNLVLMGLARVADNYAKTE